MYVTANAQRPRHELLFVPRES